MSNANQTTKLHLMEKGIVSETKIKKTRQIELTSRVFATADSYKEIIEPLLLRFLVSEVPEYALEGFTELQLVGWQKKRLTLKLKDGKKKGCEVNGQIKFICNFSNTILGVYYANN